MATKKTARPSRDVNVIFRCSDDERRTFHEAAALVGLPTSQWLRMVALAAARRERKKNDAE
jgi:hypothetical protein